MAQLNFFPNINHALADNKLVSDGSLTFMPLNLGDSISWATINLLVRTSSSANQTHSILMGLYSITGSSLSLVNSVSGNMSTNGSGRAWMSMTDTSATSNLTPGTWFLGIIARTGGTAAFQLVGTSNTAIGNNFPGSFIGGIYSVSTNALPTSLSTSEVTTSGDLFEACIILTA